jgi:hypothetical protein
MQEKAVIAYPSICMEGQGKNNKIPVRIVKI